MTGDWAGAGGGVQVVRSGHVEGSEVPVVVLNNIQLSKDTYLVGTVCYQTKLTEFVAGEAVQHHVGKHPDRGADGEDGSQPNPELGWNATDDVGDGVSDQFVEGDWIEVVTASLKNTN